MEKNIMIKGARVNNLKNIDVEIPRNKLVVITGVSGQENQASLLIRYMPKDRCVMLSRYLLMQGSF